MIVFDWQCECIYSQNIFEWLLSGSLLALFLNLTFSPLSGSVGWIHFLFDWRMFVAISGQAWSVRLHFLKPITYSSLRPGLRNMEGTRFLCSLFLCPHSLFLSFPFSFSLSVPPSLLSLFIFLSLSPPVSLLSLSPPYLCAYRRIFHQ